MGKDVLIVDDEPNIVISLQFLMQQAGFMVRVAADGMAAMSLIAERPPDLVLLDIMLPWLDGWEVCRRIRANPAWQGMKVLLLTAKGRDVDVEKGLALGADGYVTKPFSTRELVQMVQKMLVEETAVSPPPQENPQP
ncbi:MAG: response regulator [Chloroflexota bacterium]